MSLRVEKKSNRFDFFFPAFKFYRSTSKVPTVDRRKNVQNNKSSFKKYFENIKKKNKRRVDKVTSEKYINKFSKNNEMENSYQKNYGDYEDYEQE